VQIGGMTVDEMLERMNLAEFTNWMAYYSDDGKIQQKPEQIKSALKMSLATGRKKKR
jgi:hypothetical protein